MEIRPNDLPRHLSRKIEPLYVIHGDEPLLALEAGDEIRAARLARQNQRASDDVLTYLAVRSEGNLLAAKQEIEKLALVLPEGPISLDAVENATVDVARYDLLQASEAWLAGDCVRTVRIVSALEAEGEPVPRLLWQVTEDLRAIAAAQAASRKGASIAASRSTG